MGSPVDHLVFATPDLDDCVTYLEQLLGVKAVKGGNHPGLGTCNALFSLGKECYLEVIGPDLLQTDFQGTRPFGIDALETSQLVSWVARRKELKLFAQNLNSRAVSLGEVFKLSRDTGNGELIEWEMAFIADVSASAAKALPLLIDWGNSPNPASQCSNGALLHSLELLHPQPSEIEPIVRTLELDVQLTQNREAGIRAHINSPNGDVALSSIVAC